MSSSIIAPSPEPTRSERLSRRRRTSRFFTSRALLIFLLLYCGFLFCYGLGTGDFYRTEGLRAIIAAEFLRSGNWIVPTLYGEPLLTKPPGAYAAIALCSLPFGQVTEWSARLPSALAATATVLLTYWYFRRQLGRRAGFLAALLLPLSFAWFDKASSAEIDMLQTAWVTAAILFFLRALEAEERGAQRADCPTPHASRLTPHAFWWFAAMLCVAGGVLTKWTAPVFFYGTAIPLLWRRKQLHLLWSRHHLVGAAIAASVCLAWVGAAVAQVGWDTFYNTVSGEFWMRVLPSHHRRSYPWLETLTHPLLIFLTALPVSALALPALRPSFAQGWNARGRRLLEALHCWIWPSLLFWSLLPEHSPRHSLPLYPAIAGLAALVWIKKGRGARGEGRVARDEGRGTRGEMREEIRPFLPRVLLFTFCFLLVVWVGIKLAFVHVVIPERDLKRQTRHTGEQLAASVPEGETLYLFHFKDEGVMFYYARPARRLPGPEQLPSSSEPLYCILKESEWRQWPSARPAEEVQRLCDAQGDATVLVRVKTSGK